MLAIKNFGHIWSREKAFWGRQGSGNEGHLKGRRKAKKSTIIDFREQIGIYALYDEGRKIVYVGEAGIKDARLFRRLKDHRADHLRDRWAYFSWFGLADYNEKTHKLWGHDKPETLISEKRNRDALYEIESVLIQLVEPTLNKQGSKWTNTEEFLQYVDSRIPAEPVETLQEISDRLKRLESKFTMKKQK